MAATAPRSECFSFHRPSHSCSVIALLIELASSPVGPAPGTTPAGSAVALALSRALDALPHGPARRVVLQGAGDGGRHRLSPLPPRATPELTGRTRSCSGSRRAEGVRRGGGTATVSVPLAYTNGSASCAPGSRRPSRARRRRAPGRGAAPAFPARMSAFRRSRSAVSTATGPALASAGDTAAEMAADAVDEASVRADAGRGDRRRGHQARVPAAAGEAALKPA